MSICRLCLQEHYTYILINMEQDHPKPEPMHIESEDIPHPPQPATHESSQPSTAEGHQSSPDKKEVIESTPLQNRRNKYLESQDIKGRLLCDMPFYFEKQVYAKVNHCFVNTFSVIPADHPTRIKFSALLKGMKDHKNYDPSVLGLTVAESRGTAAVLGMAVADALGASTEFESFKKEGLGVIKNGFSDIKNPRHGKIGIWTDDASMGLCMADSVLLNDYQFDPTHIRYLFNWWLRHGLNNGGRPHSIGLGGNISISMDEFMYEQNPFTAQGNQFNNGNGSLMRLAPIPIAYSDKPAVAIENSRLQSLTTHNGLEAAECSRLMANILVSLINRPEGTDGRAVILDVCNNFKSPIASVQFLAKGQCEPQQHYEALRKENKKFKSFNKSVMDRNWNWREKEHTYSPTRLKQQPGYIGSYCMDALAMALHTVWFTSSWKQVAIVNADMGGDCDTVGSIAGQIAGALYGIESGLLELYSEMVDFEEGRFEAFLKGYMLASKQML